MLTKAIKTMSLAATLALLSLSVNAEVAESGPVQFKNVCGLFDGAWNPNCRRSSYNPEQRPALGYTRVAVGSRQRTSSATSPQRRRTSRPASESEVSASHDNEMFPAAWSTRRATRSTYRGEVSCVSRAILKSAKRVAAGLYGNHSKSIGKCARAVRFALDRAGLNNGGGLGDAMNYHDRPGRAGGVLVEKGFVNRINEFPSPESAPPGAILVFSGPRTPEYLRTGRYPNQAARDRMGVGAGTWVGHITVKGDDGFYYTDGRTPRAAVSNRRLVGVYLYNESRGIPRRARALCN